MRNFIIATSSTCDIDRDWLDEHDIPVISYTFTLDDKIYIDDCREATRRTLYSAMLNGTVPNTSQITTYNYYEFFKKLVKTGKPVVMVDMDKPLSASFNNSINAAEMIREEFPDATLEILDTRCITMGLALLVKTMARMADNGATFEETVAWANANCRNITHRFMVDDLQWLVHGGRLSATSALAGMLLAIKPLLHVTKEGKVDAYNKVRGKKKAMSEMIADAQKAIGDGSGKDIFIGYSEYAEEGEKWKAKVMEAFPNANSIELMELGPTIACHVGPGFLGIAYLAEDRT